MIRIPGIIQYDSEYIRDVRNVFISDTRLELTQTINKINPNISSELYLNSKIKERIKNGIWEGTLLDEKYSSKIYKVKTYR